MTLNSKTSYSIQSTSGLIETILINYIIYINSVNGVHLGQSILGNMLIVSDTENPSKHKTVISKIPRDDKFHLVDIDKEWASIFVLIENIKNPDMIKFVRTLVGTLDEKYLLLKQILFCVGDTTFDKDLASSIVNKEYKLRFSTNDKINSIISLINDFSENSWLHFTHQVHSGDFGLIISTLERANNGEIKQIQQNGNTIKNLLNISISALKAENFEDFQLYLLKTVVK